MTDNQRFTQLLAEFRRVGVDPDTFSAVIAVTPTEALQVLGALADEAGPAAFLTRLREAREERGERLSPPRGVPVQPADVAAPPPAVPAASAPAASESSRNARRHA